MYETTVISCHWMEALGSRFLETDKCTHQTLQALAGNITIMANGWLPPTEDSVPDAKVPIFAKRTSTSNNDKYVTSFMSYVHISQNKINRSWIPLSQAPSAPFINTS